MKKMLGLIKRHILLSRPEEAAFVVWGVVAIAVLSMTDIKLGFLPREIFRVFFSLKFVWMVLLGMVYMILVYSVKMLSDRKESRKELQIRLWAIFRDFSVFIMCIGIYSVLKFLVPFTVKGDMDVLLARADLFIFGVNPFIWALKYTPGWFMFFLVFSYASYFWAVPVLAVIIYIKQNYKLFRYLMLAIALSSFAGYLGYILVPAVSPRWSFRDMYNEKYQVAVKADPADYHTPAHKGIPRDCFPSLHVAWALITLFFCYYFNKFLFHIYLPFGIGLVISTVFLGWHYVIDIPAGIIFGAMGVWMSIKVNDIWERERARLTVV